MDPPLVTPPGLQQILQLLHAHQPVLLPRGHLNGLAAMRLWQKIGAKLLKCGLKPNRPHRVDALQGVPRDVHHPGHLQELLRGTWEMPHLYLMRGSCVVTSLHVYVFFIGFNQAHSFALLQTDFRKKFAITS